MNFKILSCSECGHLSALEGSAGHPMTVPGTGRLDCVHVPEVIGYVQPHVLAHAALSTVLRAVPAMSTEADMCHVLQDWLSVPNWFAGRNGMPGRLLTGYGVSSDGLSTARIVAKAMSRTVGMSSRDVLYWQAAVNVLRVRV